MMLSSGSDRLQWAHNVLLKSCSATCMSVKSKVLLEFTYNVMFQTITVNLHTFFIQNYSCKNDVMKKFTSRAWFRSTDLWVMGPARFHCATLLIVPLFSKKAFKIKTEKLREEIRHCLISEHCLRSRLKIHLQALLNYSTPTDACSITAVLTALQWVGRTGADVTWWIVIIEKACKTLLVCSTYSQNTDHYNVRSWNSI